eukprot:SAG11_NODE_1869_length_4151_cov_5.154245_6_plen_213_part_00
MPGCVGGGACGGEGHRWLHWCATSRLRRLPRLQDHRHPYVTRPRPNPSPSTLPHSHQSQRMSLPHRLIDLDIVGHCFCSLGGQVRRVGGSEPCTRGGCPGQTKRYPGRDRRRDPDSYHCGIVGAAVGLLWPAHPLGAASCLMGACDENGNHIFFVQQLCCLGATAVLSQIHLAGDREGPSKAHLGRYDFHRVMTQRPHSPQATVFFSAFFGD